MESPNMTYILISAVPKANYIYSYFMPIYPAILILYYYNYR